MQLKHDNVQGFDAQWDQVLPLQDKSFRRRYVEKCVQEAAPFLRGIETSQGFVSPEYSPEKEAASYSRMIAMVCRYVEQKIGDNNFNARKEDRSLQDASWKGSTEGNPTGSGKNTSEDRNMEIVINGPRKDNVPGEIRSPSSTT